MMVLWISPLPTNDLPLQSLLVNLECGNHHSQTWAVLCSLLHSVLGLFIYYSLVPLSCQFSAKSSSPSGMIFYASQVYQLKMKGNILPRNFGIRISFPSSPHWYGTVSCSHCLQGWLFCFLQSGRWVVGWQPQLSWAWSLYLLYQ